MDKQRAFTNFLLALILYVLAWSSISGRIRFDRAVDRIEKAINQYATPNADGSPR